MAKITSTGYELKTENEYYSEEKALYTTIDPEWNLDPSSPDGLKLASDAELYYELDELGMMAYNSKDPDKAAGIDLTTLCKITGTKRSDGTHSTVILELSGNAGAIIPAGSLAQNPTDGTKWATDASATIASGGTINASATCTVIGATEAAVGEITQIVTTVAGWLSVTNNNIATPGLNQENDAELRIRRENEVNAAGNAMVDAMAGAVLRVPNVNSAIIYENDTGTTNANGQIKNSLAVIVGGGNDRDIAEAMFSKKCPGSTLTSLSATSDTVVVPSVYDLYSF